MKTERLFEALERWFLTGFSGKKTERIFLPDPDKYILVSFENFPIPMIGIYTVDDDDGGTFRISDEDDSFLEHGLYVNAWMELPERYKEGRS